MLTQIPILMYLLFSGWTTDSRERQIIKWGLQAAADLRVTSDALELPTRVVKAAYIHSYIHQFSVHLYHAQSSFFHSTFFTLSIPPVRDFPLNLSYLTSDPTIPFINRSFSTIFIWLNHLDTLLCSTSQFSGNISYLSIRISWVYSNIS